MRVCDICGKPMKEGYFVLGTYYCSDECLSKDFTREEFDEMYKDGEDEAYWTEWED